MVPLPELRTVEDMRRGCHVFIFGTLSLRHPREDVKSAAVFLGQELRGGVWTVSHLTQGNTRSCGCG